MESTASLSKTLISIETRNVGTYSCWRKQLHEGLACSVSEAEEQSRCLVSEKADIKGYFLNKKSHKKIGVGKLNGRNIGDRDQDTVAFLSI